VQLASFDLGDPVLDAGGLRLSVQIVTLENLYGVDPEALESSDSGGARVLRGMRLRWAGGQEHAPGEVALHVERAGAQTWRLRVEARAPAPIRCVKILVRDLPPELATSADADSWTPVDERGTLWSYPGRLHTPLLWLRAGTRVLGIRAEDERVREKRFAAWRERWGPFAGRGCLELIDEQEAPRFAPAFGSATFVLAEEPDREGFGLAHRGWLERAFGLVPWAERSDVPAWARHLRGVVTLHGMHWSGRVLLDYAAMARVLRFVAERADPRWILAYLPGWEGRYYWQYGDYRPEPRLGGERGFATLCDEARRLGIRLMPMFGAHCVNAELPRFRDLDPRARLASATGRRFHGNAPDWDLARAHDPGWQAWLNPGHPGWRDDLAGQIEGLAGRFGFEAVFLDTTEVWTNDHHHSVYDGLRALVDRLRTSLPGVLLAGEYDYDALAALFPLFQRAWWSEAPAWTRRYVRRFGHLCEGEPEGRTGVHELGAWRAGAVPAGAGRLATLAFQDGTLERSRPAVEAALAALRDG
jgi:hypothetical protein